MLKAEYILPPIDEDGDPTPLEVSKTGNHCTEEALVLPGHAANDKHANTLADIDIVPEIDGDINDVTTIAEHLNVFVAGETIAEKKGEASDGPKGGSSVSLHEKEPAHKEGLSVGVKPKAHVVEDTHIVDN